MTRPCFLIVDREHAGSISTRKLVIETAKLNVITAYSGAEAMDTLARFPGIDGIVLDAGVADVPCQELLQAFKRSRPEIPVVVIETPRPIRCEGADHYLDAFEPSRLLELLQRIIPEAQRVVDREKAESPTIQ